MIRDRKTCKHCEVEKPLDEFRTQTATKGRDCVGRVYYTATCIECDNNRRKTLYRSQREDVHWQGIFRRYGLTKDHWLAIFDAQGRRCACCGRTEPGAKGWQVDHDHTTRRVRGIVCMHCNRLFGAAEDSVEILEAAIAYLTRVREDAHLCPDDPNARPWERRQC